MNELQTFIFMGPAGSGKTTQAKRLMDHLQEADPARDQFYSYTGERLREFVQEEGYTQNRVREIMHDGGRVPDFFAVLMWGEAFIENLNGNEHIFIDGSPRSRVEAESLDTALSFYGRKKPFVFELNVHKDTSVDRLLARARHDDTREGIAKRVSWYHTDVTPAVDYYRDNDAYEFVSITGDGTEDEVHERILEVVETRLHGVAEPTLM